MSNKMYGYIYNNGEYDKNDIIIEHSRIITRSIEELEANMKELGYEKQDPFSDHYIRKDKKDFSFLTITTYFIL